MSDVTGHDAPQPDELHTLTLTELEGRVAAAGVLISRRQLMRHCEAGTFDAKRLPAVNNLEQWFVAPASIDKGIADIKTLQELRARRDATRPVVTDHDAPMPAQETSHDMSGHDAPQRAMSDARNEDEQQLSVRDTTGHDASDYDIYDHPYVKRLEDRVDKLEAKYEAQVRRTEEIQMKSQQQIIELQRMTAIGQSQTLADFMLKARDWVLGQGSEVDKTDTARAGSNA
jgi:hypothetical protein